MTANEITAITPITLNFPNWFYGIFSVAFVILIFYTGLRWNTLRDICHEFPKIRRALDLISQKLCELGHFPEHVYISTSSPKSLTNIGRQMLDNSGLKRLIDVNKDELIKRIEARKPATDYDIEQASVDLMMSLSDDPRVKPAKDYAFQNGKELSLMLLAAGVYLRDVVLQSRG